MSRLIILEVADTQTQDDIHLAIEEWNVSHDPGGERQIRIIQQTSIIVGEDK